MKRFSIIDLRFSLECGDRVIEYIQLRLSNFDFPYHYVGGLCGSVSGHHIHVHTDDNHVGFFKLTVNSSFNNSSLLDYVRDSGIIRNFGSAEIKDIRIFLPDYFTEEEITGINKSLSTFCEGLPDIVPVFSGMSYSTNNPMLELEIINIIITTLDKYGQQRKRDP